jgi:C1A family cysteine protease
MKRIYGWKVDLPDHRDFLYKNIQPLDIAVPNFIDLRDKCSAIENQGSLGSCTANALAGNLEFLELKTNAIYFEASRLFIYYNERLLEHTVPYDSGATLRNGIKAIARAGYCDEKDWQYDITKFTKRPSIKCYLNALHHRITSYYSMTSLNEFLNCLASGYPFVFGIAVYDSFESAEVAKTGIVPMPDSMEGSLGGHAVCAVGYDLTEKVFIVRNSWGAEWGMEGYFYLPFRYVETLANDFWTIRK